MSNIKDQIVTLLKQRHHSHKVALEQEKDPRSKHAVDLIARIREDSQLIELIDSLPEENNPEPYNPVYDEDYLNEKIAKATKSWEGVDVDKMLAECRGYEEKPSEDLEEAASRGGFDYVDEIEAKAPGLPWNDHDVEFGYRDGFIAGAEWMRKKDVEDMYMSDNRHFLKCYEQGKVDMKVEMMKDAMDAEITVGRLSDDWSLAYNPDELHRALLKFKSGDKVKIIIVKKKEEET